MKGGNKREEWSREEENKGSREGSENCEKREELRYKEERRDMQSMSREEQRQKAREQREQKAASCQREREPQPVMFGVVPKSRHNTDLEHRTSQDRSNAIERVLGKYNNFAPRVGSSKLPIVGMEQQPATPHPLPDTATHPGQTWGPTSPSSSCSSSSSSTGRSSSQQRPALPQSTIKPPHPPSNHAHTKNGEVKGNLKGGPGPGPGEGGGGGWRGGVGQTETPSMLKVTEGVVDQKIQHIMADVRPRPPMSALLTTPRQHTQNFFPPAHRDQPRPHQSRLSKTGETARSKQSKAFEGSQVNDELVLSEESEDEEGRRGSRSSASSGGASGGGGRMVSSFSNSAQLQLPLVDPTPAPVIPPLSPISPKTKHMFLPKTSDDSSSSKDSSDDTEQSSNNSSEDEQPECSPKHQENKSHDWKLVNFFPNRKHHSPISQGSGSVGSSGPRPEDSNTTPAAAPSREKRERRVGKPQSGVRGGSESRRRSRGDRQMYDDSSDDGEPHHRPTPRVSAEVRETPRPTRDTETRSRQSKTKTAPTRIQNSDSDSDSDVAPRKPRMVQPCGPLSSGKGTTPIIDKSPKVAPPQPPRESPKKNSRKRADTVKRESHVGSKAESGAGSRSKRKQHISNDIVDTDTDSEGQIDVVNSTPEKHVSRATPQGTPSRTPREVTRGVSSPVKLIQASPRLSPKVSVLGKNSVKRERTSVGLSDSESEDEAPIPSRQVHSQKTISAREKSALVHHAFGSTAKKDKSARDRDPVETKGKVRNYNERKSGGTCRERREKSGEKERSKVVNETNSVDGRLVGSAPSTGVNNNNRSSLVSAEPKVPIPHVLYQDGVPKLTCTISISLIDKVPKPSVNNGATSQLCKTEVKEEVDSKKKVLDNRTKGGKGGKGGKGKRKTCDPGTKVPEDVSKRKIITSIFGGKRQDHESDDDKVKKEIKKEVVESDEERCERTAGKSLLAVKDRDPKEELEEKLASRSGGGSLRHRQVSASPMSSVSDTSTSRHHRKKKRQDRSPYRDRKRPKSHSEREAGDYGSGDESRSEPRGGSEDRVNTSSRKRTHDRESSLESTRSQSRGEDKQRSSKRPRLSHSPAPAPPPPAPPLASPAAVAGAGGGVRPEQEEGWEKEATRPTKHSQRTSNSQQSSQYSQKGYIGEGRDESGTTHESEGGEDEDEEEDEEEEEEEEEEEAESTGSTHSRIYGKGKCEESGATPGAESTGYSSRPTSEHESRVGGSGADSCPSTAPTSEGGGTGMGAPQRQNAASSTPNTSATTLQSSCHTSDQDYMQYLNMAKELKHSADGEADRSNQAMKYLEAALYFILSGKAMEGDPDHSASLTMYRDTLNFIKWVSSVFRRENQEGSINTKLAVISLRCQSLLTLKIYKMLRTEHRENQRKLHAYFQNHSRTEGVEGNGGSGGGQQWASGSGRTTSSPSHLSQTPSPAGSVGSEGSQSSGYTTSTEGTRYRRNGIPPPPVNNTPPHPQPPQGSHVPTVPTVPVPVSIHQLMVKQHHLSAHLASAYDMWMEADHYIRQNSMQDFFIELDRQARPLTLHSSLYELVCYVQFGLQRLKDWPPPSH
ncbi:hypothetical protein Pcinc_016185 [Petrolisthes cinctipes]|uniref:AF4/FMR2 family member lilli n=1 Tax=Petrolisthes cinctipes TaxID=88211 RepID=A0AAE1FU71_PETCI|nr:hypothetical protein Pcinc_016185 [Petrolisthes cinctipes]